MHAIGQKVERKLQEQIALEAAEKEDEDEEDGI